MSKGELRWHKTDLHVHSVLSPCAELEMGPSNIIARCKEVGLTLIGICDHNTGANLPAFINKAKDENLTVLSGMEVQTREEVHCLCFFPDYKNLKQFEEEFRDTLPKINNNPKLFGDQVVIDENEQILYHEERLLLTSSSLGVSELVKLVKNYNGEVIPAHIDKKSYSLISNLGFIPSHEFLAMEIFDYKNRGKISYEYSEIKRYPVLVSSDAHKLDDINRSYQTYFYIVEPNWKEIVLAFKNKGGRRLAVIKRDYYE